MTQTRPSAALTRTPQHPPARDLILVRDFTVETIIGIEPEERIRRQPVVLHLDLEADVRRAAETDRIEDALNYDALTRRLGHFIETTEFNLIETLAERLAALIIEEFSVSWLRLELRKPQALAGSTDVGLVIERARDG